MPKFWIVVLGLMMTTLAVAVAMLFSPCLALVCGAGTMVYFMAWYIEGHPPCG